MPDIAQNKKRTNISITNECDRLMEEIAALLGVSRNVVVELAVRELAKQHGLKIQPVERPDSE